MTRKADGKPSQIERIAFTRPAAERIAKAVRTVEAGDRDQPGITYGSALGVSRKVFRVCTFTGAWSIGATKTVTLKNQAATPNTVAAVNLFAAVPAPGSSGDCAIAKDGTAWYLIAAVCS
jgi:hypothetical protein